MDRHLVWDGCRNVRDLGGLPLRGGGSTLFGQVIRSDNPSRLTAAGWDAVGAVGVRTVIALRTIGATDDEGDPAMLPDGITVERLDLEDATDPEFRRRCIDTNFWATPIEWSEMLRNWPERCAAAVDAVARAPDGAVVISCGLGRDRTGLVAFLLQAVAGVTAEAIAADWTISMTRLAGDPLADTESVAKVLEREATTIEAVVRAALDMDVESRLIDGGVEPANLTAVRARLVG